LSAPEAAAKTRWRGAALGLLATVALLGLVLASADMRALLLAAMAQVTLLSVLATLPGQAAAMLICAAALHALRPGVGYLACLASRVLRDASGNLPISPPGFSAVIGARSLVLSGGETRAAISASVLDKFAEVASQLPFIALAVAVLWQAWPEALKLPLDSAAIAIGIVIAILLGAALWRKFGGRSRLEARVIAEWHKLVEVARLQGSGLPLSLVLHGAAWLAGGVQIWMAAWALGYDLSLFEAIAVESAAYAGRAVFFFIPAGLVSQEAGLLAAGLVFGLTAPQALALGLVLRLRDLLMAGGLLLWPLLEWRRKRA
jgi:hypothetical protein